MNNFRQGRDLLSCVSNEDIEMLGMHYYNTIFLSFPLLLHLSSPFAKDFSKSPAADVTLADLLFETHHRP